MSARRLAVLATMAVAVLGGQCFAPTSASATGDVAKSAASAAKPSKKTPALTLTPDRRSGVFLVLDRESNYQTVGLEVRAARAPKTVLLQRREAGSWVDLRRFRTKGGFTADYNVYIAPNEGTNYLRLLSPGDSTHRRAVTAILTVEGYAPPEGSDADIQAARLRTLNSYNAQRRDAGLPPVAMRDDLNAIAQEIMEAAYYSSDAASVFVSGYEKFNDRRWWTSGYCGGGSDGFLNPDGTEPNDWIGGLDHKILEPDATHVAIGFYRGARKDEWRGVSYVIYEDTTFGADSTTN